MKNRVKVVDLETYTLRCRCTDFAELGYGSWMCLWNLKVLYVLSDV